MFGHPKRMGNNQSPQQPKESYFWDSTGRYMHPAQLAQKPPATPKTEQEWMLAQTKARISAQPKAGPYSQLDAPVISSLDPSQLTQNPLIPFQDQIQFMLTTFKNRNANHDLRGQPPLPADWNTGQDQLVQVRSVARLDRHGAAHQSKCRLVFVFYAMSKTLCVVVTGCTTARAPMY